MLLAVDAGNTNIVFGVFDTDKLLGKWRIETDAARSADEYRKWLIQSLERQGIAPSKIKHGMLSCVVPKALAPLRELAQQLHINLPAVGEPEVKLNIGVKIDNPATVGADRLVNTAAAWKKYEQAAMVIDMGTATTFDVVNGKGEFIGGAIAPGPKLALEALWNKAGNPLPHIDITPPAKAIGTTTAAAMQSGIFYGYSGLIENITAKIKKEYGKPLKIIATGGLSSLYAKACPSIEHHEPDLTLWGLKEIWEINA